jgi:hypothetical protein
MFYFQTKRQGKQSGLGLCLSALLSFCLIVISKSIESTTTLQHINPKESIFSIIPVALTHDAHEGSHAIGESLAAYPCVIFLEEKFTTIKMNEEEGKKLRAEALDMFFGVKDIDIHELFKILKAFSNLHDEDAGEALGIYRTCKAFNQTVYLAALMRDFDVVARKKEIGEAKRLKYYPIVRTKIMNFALSISKDEMEALGRKHPQFGGQVTELVQHTFNISNLRKSSHTILDNWNEKITSVVSMTKSKDVSCDNVRFVVYEDYLLNPEEFTFNLYQSLLASTGGGRKAAATITVPMSLSDDEHEISVHRVHTDDISVFVKNDAQVRHFFNVTKYPTFDELAKKSDLPCPLKKLRI